MNLYQFDARAGCPRSARAGVAEHRKSGWVLRDVVRTLRADLGAGRTHPARAGETQLDDAALAASVTPALPAVERTRAEHFVLPAQRPGCRGVRGDLLGALVLSAERCWRCACRGCRSAFGSLRSGGLGKRLFIGIVFALGFWMLQTMFGNLAQAYRFDIRIAYMLPLAVMLGVSAWLFRRRSG